MTTQKLDAGSALVDVTKILTAWLEDTDLEAEKTMEEIGAVVDKWKGASK